MQFTCPLILASGSPRRKQLLEQLNINFTIQVSDVDESFEAATTPSQIVEDIAARKAQAIGPLNPNALTIAADTIVVLEGSVLGKPEDARDAFNMLRRLSDNQHTVYTGLALAHYASNRLVTTHEKTSVFFGPMSDAEIMAYVASGSPMDKAGAYGIQDDKGALFVARIEGDFYNVVGLPLFRLYRTLKRHFADLLVD